MIQSNTPYYIASTQFTMGSVEQFSEIYLKLKHFYFKLNQVWRGVWCERIGYMVGEKFSNIQNNPYAGETVKNS
jgi:hypothetical protein